MLPPKIDYMVLIHDVSVSQKCTWYPYQLKSKLYTKIDYFPSHL